MTTKEWKYAVLSGEMNGSDNLERVLPGGATGVSHTVVHPKAGSHFATVKLSVTSLARDSKETFGRYCDLVGYEKARELAAIGSEGEGKLPDAVDMKVLGRGRIWLEGKTARRSDPVKLSCEGPIPCVMHKDGRVYTFLPCGRAAEVELVFEVPGPGGTR